MAIAEEWRKSLSDLRTLLDGMEQKDDGWEIPGGLRQRLQQIISEKGSNERLVYIFGQLDPEKMIAVAREGLVPWWPAFNGRAYFGDIAAVKKIYAAFEENSGKSDRPSLSSSMTWVSHPYALNGGETRNPDPRILSLLLDWGADPMYEQGKYYDKALRQSSAEIIGVFVKHKAPYANARAAYEELMKAKNHTQALNLQKARGFDGFYTKVDNDTLLETKYAREAGGRDSVFKTLFNFRARRVTEVYETGAGAEARAAMAVTGFDQYDAQALRHAQEVLEKLGGKPPDALGKPRLAKLGA